MLYYCLRKQVFSRKRLISAIFLCAYISVFNMYCIFDQNNTFTLDQGIHMPLTFFCKEDSILRATHVLQMPLLILYELIELMKVSILLKPKHKHSPFIFHRQSTRENVILHVYVLQCTITYYPNLILIQPNSELPFVNSLVHSFSCNDK